MYLQHYTYKTNASFLDYEFYSTGPKGKIKKAVRFTQISANVYNLGFGDVDAYTGQISDMSVTNNEDSRKVLATVAVITDFFTSKHPHVWVVAQGSTHSRNRLYRMGIANNFTKINALFNVFGLKDNKWESFKLHRDYNAFLIQRK